MEAGDTLTFHLPCGEMTPMLQDVAYLLGLPIVGEAVGPRVVAASWKDDLEARLPWLTAWKKQVQSTRTREQQVLRRHGSYSLQYVFIPNINLIVTIHMFHCQLKPLILIVYAACPVGCGCRRVQCDQIAGVVSTLVVWLHHVQQHSWQLGR